MLPGPAALWPDGSTMTINASCDGPPVAKDKERTAEALKLFQRFLGSPPSPPAENFRDRSSSVSREQKSLCANEVDRNYLERDFLDDVVVIDAPAKDDNTLQSRPRDKRPALVLDEDDILIINRAQRKDNLTCSGRKADYLQRRAARAIKPPKVIPPFSAQTIAKMKTPANIDRKREASQSTGSVTSQVSNQQHPLDAPISGTRLPCPLTASPHPAMSRSDSMETQPSADIATSGVTTGQSLYPTYMPPFVPSAIRSRLFAPASSQPKQSTDNTMSSLPSGQSQPPSTRIAAPASQHSQTPVTATESPGRLLRSPIWVFSCSAELQRLCPELDIVQFYSDFYTWGNDPKLCRRVIEEKYGIRVVNALKSLRPKIDSDAPKSEVKKGADDGLLSGEEWQLLVHEDDWVMLDKLTLADD